MDKILTAEAFTASYLTDVKNFEHKVNDFGRDVYCNDHTVMVDVLNFWSIWYYGELVYMGNINTIAFFEELLLNIGITI